MGPVGKAFDFAFYLAVAVVILATSLLWLPPREALVTATAMFVISAGLILYVSFSGSQKKRIQRAPYHRINYKIFSPFALVLSFVAICYLLNDVEPAFFVGSKNASVIDFSMFAADNVLRVVFWDLPEIYGLAASGITHNTAAPAIATLVFVFRALIGLSLIRMLILLLRS